MKYERLTPGVLFSDVIKEYGICVGEPLIGTFGGHDIVELVDRLVELEDKIERGELIERTSEECSAVRKQAVKEFADEFKRRYFFMMTTYMKDPIYQCTGDELDRFVKEVCGE